jgi:predicted nucleotidyltransferase
VPDFVAENLKEIQRPANIEDLATAILTLLHLSEPRRLAQIDNISEGLENKILHSAAASFSIAELIGSIKSARYPYSRLQRIMLHILFNVTKDDMAAFIKEGPQYIRVLGFNKNGQSLLRKLKGSARLPVIVKTAQYLNSKARCNKSSLLEKMLAYDTLATDIYSLLENKPSGGDFTRGAVRLD